MADIKRRLEHLICLHIDVETRDEGAIVRAGAAADAILAEFPEMQEWREEDEAIQIAAMWLRERINLGDVGWQNYVRDAQSLVRQLRGPSDAS